MKLYYAPGAPSLAPHIALCEIDRSFELERVDLRTLRTASSGTYLAINPRGDLPALQLDEPGREMLTGTAATLLYLADLAPEHLLAPAAGTFARYHLISWLDFIALELHAHFEPLFAPETPAPVQVRARGKLGERFLYLADVLIDRAYLMGETFHVADAYLFAVLRWCERFELDLAIWPNLDDYFHRCLDRPAVQRALAAEGLLEQHPHRRSA